MEKALAFHGLAVQPPKSTCQVIGAKSSNEDMGRPDQLSENNIS